MTAKEAVAKRILELCGQRNIAVNALATLSGVSSSTIYSMLNEKSKNPGVVSIKKLCDGLKISVLEFFNSELFDDLEQEIKKHRMPKTPSVKSTPGSLRGGHLLFSKTNYRAFRSSSTLSVFSQGSSTSVRPKWP